MVKGFGHVSRSHHANCAVDQTLGNYTKIEQAKQACERHYAAGCDLSRAEIITR